MSEINSIAQGTYTIGQTSATTYQAGPGISITQPSEGTVRISNDETVLFETTAQNVSAVTLTEPLSAFERFRFYPLQAGAGYFNYREFDYNVVQSLAAGNNIRLLFSRGIGGNNPLQFLIGEYKLSNDRKSITGISGYRRWFPMGNGAGGYDSNYTYIQKIVGINRISGGNA
jgi:hypothetical protein